MDTKESNNDSAAPDVQLGTYLQEQPQQEQEQVQLQTQPQPIPSQVQIPLQEEAAVPEAVAVQAEVAVTPLPQSTVQPVTVQPDAYEQPMNGEQARTLAQNLIHTYFTTIYNPLTRHQTESYDQFLYMDLPNIIAAQNWR